METHRLLKILLGVIFPSLFLLAFFFFYLLHYCYSRRVLISSKDGDSSLEGGGGVGLPPEAEELIAFAGGEDLTLGDVLEAPGEVIGKSSYSTVYKATLDRTGSPVLLRFVRPACIGRTADVIPAVRVLGSIRHPNLVPLRALYAGPRGEKLFVHPFYPAGNLAQFLKRDGVAESHKREIIHKLSLGIAKGLDHLHNALRKPIIHGNLKTNNIMLDGDLQPRLSDFGLHLILSPAAGQEMLEASAAQGYKPPELIKMKHATKQSDIYNLGVVFLEIIMKNHNLLRARDHHRHSSPSFKDLILEQKISEFASRSKSFGHGDEEGMLTFFQLAMACCSPSPESRPDVNHVLTRLQEIGCNSS
ncbi:putative kinase-like protein TMKL1 [Typha angustifolia]|uniref:putative kinase-like protein TMKL1 n=1 Tax=Typha angustifolia TaxID=59011 RepID=UPI003C2BEFD7